MARNIIIIPQDDQDQYQYTRYNNGGWNAFWTLIVIIIAIIVILISVNVIPIDTRAEVLDPEASWTSPENIPTESDFDVYIDDDDREFHNGFPIRGVVKKHQFDFTWDLQKLVNLFVDAYPDLGVSRIAVDGVYGDQTISAIKQIQNYIGDLKVDGKAGPKTIHAMINALHNPLQK